MTKSTRELLDERAELTSQLAKVPYSILFYLQRAHCHEALCYPDLAVGDAYKALMLHDELDAGEFEDEVRQTLSEQRHSPGWLDLCLGRSNGYAVADSTESTGLTSHSIGNLYFILVKNLAATGDKKAALRFARQGMEASSKHHSLLEIHNELQSATKLPGEAEEKSLSFEVSERLVRREIYPWNDHEPDRFSESGLDLLNVEMRKYAPKCQVLAVDLPILSGVENSGAASDQVKPEQGKVRQLGIFAIEDIAPGEVILLEPSVLTASSRELEPLCDTCSATLPSLTTGGAVMCSSCSDIYFCSEACHQRAAELYHPAVCGLDDYNAVAKDPSRTAATDALYVLLLSRAFAMAETQGLHPLDLFHTKFLWGDFQTGAKPNIKSLPFNFESNIAQPLQILMSMGVDVFSPRSVDRYDIWVLNTLFAKFRGVASAKLNPNTLLPDVAAVHPIWCLANHSCDPNVRWEWGAEDGAFKGQEKGAMGFAARKDSEIVQWGPCGHRAGIKKGQELLNHYCDVGMNVKERREWAAGALGGKCVCERCVWEEGQR